MSPGNLSLLWRTFLYRKLKVLRLFQSLMRTLYFLSEDEWVGGDITQDQPHKSTLVAHHSISMLRKSRRRKGAIHAVVYNGLDSSVHKFLLRDHCGSTLEGEAAWQWIAVTSPVLQ